MNNTLFKYTSNNSKDTHQNLSEQRICRVYHPFDLQVLVVLSGLAVKVSPERVFGDVLDAIVDNEPAVCYTVAHMRWCEVEHHAALNETVVGDASEDD